MSARWVWAAAALGVWGCGDDDPPKARTGGNSSGLDASVDSGARMDAARDAAVDASGDGGPQGPVASIVAPFTRPSVEAFDVDADELVVAGRLDVRCDLQTNPTTDVAFNPSSAKASVTYAGDNGPDPVVKLATLQLDDTFLATFDLDTWPSGPIEIRCLADDVGEPPKTGDAIAYTYLDRGPVISVRTPVANSAFAGSDVWTAEIEVEAAPLTDDDRAGAEVSSTFFVNGVELPGSAVSVDGNVYSFLLDFDDTTYFTPGLTSASIQVRAENGRMPTPAVTELHVPLIVDDTGPEITFINPKDEDIEAGEVTVQVRVTDDAAGVDANSVRLEIASGTPVQMMPAGTNTYSYTFATRGFDPAPFITLEVTASDDAANASAAEILV